MLLPYTTVMVLMITAMIVVIIHVINLPDESWMVTSRNPMTGRDEAPLGHWIVGEIPYKDMSKEETKMGLFSNPGVINIDALRASAEVNGYKEYTRDDGDSIHHTISNGVEGSGCRYVSWDEDKSSGEIS